MQQAIDIGEEANSIGLIDIEAGDNETRVLVSDDEAGLARVGEAGLAASASWHRRGRDPRRGALGWQACHNRRRWRSRQCTRDDITRRKQVDELGTASLGADGQRYAWQTR
ncbi:unnamed protein product [Ilex paraguariensis]|uniref:Uncharacterized protein n=1 Tax=Ilex paraguariensis TaxID=185542 RepID=A0ABC8SXC2_9AQUA